MAIRYSHILPALMLPLVMFVIFPVATYIPNFQDFIDVKAIIALTAIFLVVSVVAICAIYFLAGRFGAVFTKILFLIGLFILLCDIVAPVQVDILQTGLELRDVYEPEIFNWLQLGLFVCLALAVIFVPWGDATRSAAAALVVILFAVQLVLIGTHIISTGFSNAQPLAANARQAGGNIYHVVFDTYGYGFLDHAREVNALDKFDGFTFYPAHTNAVYTELSIPSFMSGFLPGHDPEGFNKWKNKWLNEGGMVSRLEEAGYQVTEYQGHSWSFPGAAHSTVRSDVMTEIGGESDAVLFANLVLLRIAPNFLKRETFPEGRGLISVGLERMRSADGDKTQKLLYGDYARGPTAVALLKRLVREEKSRPATGQYVYAHVLLPHSPYNIDRALTTRATPTSWHEQALASVNLMTAIVDELKKLGRYENSTIIFQGDHGLEINDPSWEAMKPKGFPEGLFKDARTLLLVKPAGNRASGLQISDYPAQLIDVMPTVLSAVGLDTSGLDGVSLLAPDLPRNRDVHVFGYEPPLNEQHELRHFVLHPDGRWDRKTNELPLKGVWQ